MNVAQRILLIVALIVVAGLITFPPWLITYNPPLDFLYVQKATRPAGYHVIFSPPIAENQGELAHRFGLPDDPKDQQSVSSLNYFSIAIDKDRLAIQLVGALIMTTLFGFLFKSKHHSD